MTSPGLSPAGSVARALRRLAVTCARGTAARACRSPLPQATEGARGAGTAAAAITAATAHGDGRRRLTTRRAGQRAGPVRLRRCYMPGDEMGGRGQLDSRMAEIAQATGAT